MRKLIVTVLTVVTLTLSLTQLANAQWTEYTVTNRTTSDIYVAFSTWRLAKGAVTETGYRTVGYYRIAPNISRPFYAYQNNRIYFRILDSNGNAMKPQVGTPTVRAWVPGGTRYDFAFNIVTPSFGNRPQISFTDFDKNQLIYTDSFIKYTNGSQITVTSAWVDVFPDQGVGPDISVHIPDPNLRAKLENALGKAPGATITPAEMRTLTEFSGQESQIQDLTGLEFATNLILLKLETNEISDISPLAGLINLTELYLDSNEILDIAPLAQLKKLEILSLDNNQIGVSNLPLLILLFQLENLYSFSIEGNPVSYIIDPLTDDPVSGTVHIPDPTLRAAFEWVLKKLPGATITAEEMLTVQSIRPLIPIPGYNDGSSWVNSKPSVKSLIGIQFAKNLKGLIIEKDSFSSPLDLSPLADLKNLTTLVLSKVGNDEIQDLSLLAGLENLTELRISGSDISDISPLAGLKNLTKLIIRGTAISDISPLAGLKNLTELWISGSDISDISPLTGLDKLTELDLHNNQISDIWPLASLKNLARLVLNDNGARRWDSSTSSFHYDSELSNIWPLARLDKLTELDLHNNRISDISPLLELDKLTKLDLHNNRISDISPLEGSRNLIQLDLRNNYIVDFSPIAGINCACGSQKVVDPVDGKVVRVEVGDRSFSPGGHLRAAGYNIPITVKNSKGQPVGYVRIGYRIGNVENYLTTKSDGTTNIFVPVTLRVDKIYLTVTDQTGHELKKVIDFLSIGRSENQYGATVYKNSDGHETVLIKGLTLEGVDDSLFGDGYTKKEPPVFDDYTRFLPPRDGKHFKVYGQGDVNTCGQTSARMVLSYYGVDVGLHTFDDVAGIHTWVVGATPDEMRAGLRLLPVDLSTLSGTRKGYPRKESLRDKISQSCPPILVIRVGKNAYHHIVAVGYDTKTDSFLIANPAGWGRFYWMPWTYLNPLWRLDYQRGYTWDEFLDNLTNTNAWGQAPFIPSIKSAIQWFDGLAPYRMFVPKKAPPYHHLASRTIKVKVKGEVEYNAFKWGMLDWERERTFGGQVRHVELLADVDDSSVEEPRIDGNKVFLSGKIQNGTPLDRGFLYIVLTAYYTPSANAAPSVIPSIGPVATTLLPNYPNPFNPETWIPYHLAVSADVVLTIYSVDGKMVRRLDLGHQDAGFYQSKSRAAYWDGKNAVGERVASGLYFYTLTAGEFTATGKMLILK